MQPEPVPGPHPYPEQPTVDGFTQNGKMLSGDGHPSNTHHWPRVSGKYTENKDPEGPTVYYLKSLSQRMSQHSPLLMSTACPHCNKQLTCHLLFNPHNSPKQGTKDQRG